MGNNPGKKETSLELQRSQPTLRKTIWICIHRRHSMEKLHKEKIQDRHQPKIKVIIPQAGWKLSRREPENSLLVQKLSPKNLTQVIRGGETPQNSWQEVEILRKWAPKFLNLTMIFKRKPKSKIISRCSDSLWMKVLTRNPRKTTMWRDIAFWAAKKTPTRLKGCLSFWLKTNLRETRTIKISLSTNWNPPTNILNYNSL